MRTGIFLTTLTLACASCSANRPITQGKADEIAKDFYQDFAQRDPEQTKLLGPLVVQAHADGWHYRWSCQGSDGSGLGIFVQQDGSADYDEAPSCAPAKPIG